MHCAPRYLFHIFVQNLHFDIEMNLKATVAVCVILVCMMAVSQCSVLQIWGDWTQLDAAQLSMMFFVLALK